MKISWDDFSIDKNKGVFPSKSEIFGFKRFEQEELKISLVNMLTEEVRAGRREKKMASMNLNESKLFPKFFPGGTIGISNETKKKKLLKV